MLRPFLISALLGTTALGLAACGDGNPFYEPDADGDGIPDDEDEDYAGGDNPDNPEVTGNTVIDTGTVRPNPGSAPFPRDGSLTRLEAQGEGGGLVSSVAFVPGATPDQDRFIVDGLGFDGANAYSPGFPVGQLGSDAAGYQVYEADVQVVDPLTGNPIGQVRPYRAIYGVSLNDTDGSNPRPRTSFAIVRTGGFAGYGFGGFLYARNGSVVLPEGPFGNANSGQAVFSGEYAGMRVFDGRGGLEFTTGTLEVAIDFRDFDTNDAVSGILSDRRAYDINGVEIETGTTLDDGLLLLPDVLFTLQAGEPTLLSNGQMGGALSSTVLNSSGALEVYEEGTYYGVIAGDLTDPADGGEIVGIIVLESDDPRYDGVTAQETGGFIVYR